MNDTDKLAINKLIAEALGIGPVEYWCERYVENICRADKGCAHGKPPACGGVSNIKSYPDFCGNDAAALRILKILAQQKKFDVQIILTPGKTAGVLVFPAYSGWMEPIVKGYGESLAAALVDAMVEFHRAYLCPACNFETQRTRHENKKPIERYCTPCDLWTSDGEIKGVWCLKPALEAALKRIVDKPDGSREDGDKQARD